MATYLEEYIESVSSLPYELQQSLRLLRDLDVQSHELHKRIDSEVSDRLEILLGSKKDEGETRVSEEQAEQIEADKKKWVDLAEEKISLAVQAYDLVDDHIRRLDKDLRKFEDELNQERELLGEETLDQKGEPGSGRVLREETTKSGRKRSGAAQIGVAGIGGVNMDIDLPVDPNEPTYCYCNQVSFGEMIACDNSECKIEWYHYECVGIDERPKGKWYCPDCRANAQPRRRTK